MSIKNFTKDDLKVGYIVVSDGKPWMAMFTQSESSGMSNRMVLLNNEGRWMDLREFNNDLSCSVMPEYTITEVYGYSKFAYQARDMSTSCRTLLWKRENRTKKMTVAEIEKELGYKIEVVSEDSKR